MNPRPIHTPAQVAVKFAPQLRAVTALHDAGRAEMTMREVRHRQVLRSGAVTAKLVACGFWREENERKAGGCVVTDAKTGVVLRKI